MTSRQNKIKERLKNGLYQQSLVAQWDGWVLKIVLTVLNREQNNFFVEGTPGTSFNDAKKSNDRQRIVLMTKLDFSESPGTISPFSGMPCYRTIINPEKIEFLTSPETEMPYFKLVTEIHSGVDRPIEQIVPNGMENEFYEPIRPEGFVGITLQTWKFAIMDHMICIWNTMLSNGQEHKLQIRDADGLLCEFKGLEGIKKLYRLPPDTVLARDLQQYEDAKARGDKDARYKFPRQARTKCTTGYAHYVGFSYDIDALQIANENGGVLNGLFYLEDTDYLQYSCDNKSGMQMYPEGPPNNALGESLYGHQKYVDLSISDKNKLLNSRLLFSHTNNTLINLKYLEHFKPFLNFQQGIVRMCSCVYKGTCCYLNPHANHLESNETHNCCMLRYCVSKPDTYTKLLEEWVNSTKKVLDTDLMIIRAKKAFRLRSMAEIANKSGVEAIKTIFDRESDGIDDIDHIVSLSQSIPITNSDQNSSDSDSEKDYLPLSQIIEKLSKFIEKNAVLTMFQRSIRGNNQNSHEQIEQFRELTLNVLSTRALQFEFEKFRFRNRNTEIDNKPIKPEFWDEWRIWLGSGLSSRDYILRIKQKHYQTLGLDESKTVFSKLETSWKNKLNPPKSRTKAKINSKSKHKKPF
jgi:hypothetical protein